MAVLTDQSKMTFGKHKGKTLGEIPDYYFIWLYDQGVSGDLKVYIEESVPAIHAQVNKKPINQNK